MSKITIEDSCGEEKTFNVKDDNLVEKIKGCLIKKTSEELGNAKSTTVKMLDDEGDTMAFFLERNKDGNVEVKSYCPSIEDKPSGACVEVTFEAEGNDINVEGHYFA